MSPGHPKLGKFTEYVFVAVILLLGAVGISIPVPESIRTAIVVAIAEMFGPGLAHLVMNTGYKGGLIDKLSVRLRLQPRSGTASTTVAGLLMAHTELFVYTTVFLMSCTAIFLFSFIHVLVNPLNLEGLRSLSMKGALLISVFTLISINITPITNLIFDVSPFERKYEGLTFPAPLRLEIVWSHVYIARLSYVLLTILLGFVTAIN